MFSIAHENIAYGLNIRKHMGFACKAKELARPQLRYRSSASFFVEPLNLSSLEQVWLLSIGRRQTIADPVGHSIGIHFVETHQPLNRVDPELLWKDILVGSAHGEEPSCGSVISEIVSGSF